VLPLAPWADALMATRGIFRTVVPAAGDNALVLCAAGVPPPVATRCAAR